MQRNMCDANVANLCAPATRNEVHDELSIRKGSGVKMESDRGSRVERDLLGAREVQQ